MSHIFTTKLTPINIFDVKLNKLDLLSFREKIFHPTYSCFDNAMEFLEIAARSSPDFKKYENNFRIVHGILQSPDFIKISHAWIEVQHKFVIEKYQVDDSFVFVQFLKKEFYEVLNIIENKRYTMEKMIYWNNKTGMYGPWEKPFTDFLRERQ